MTLVDELRLKVLDRIQADGTVAFTDDELQAFLDAANGNLYHAAGAVLEALIADDDRLMKWSRGDAKMDYSRLKRDLGDVARWFYSQSDYPPKPADAGKDVM